MTNADEANEVQENVVTEKKGKKRVVPSNIPPRHIRGNIYCIKKIKVEFQFQLRL